MPAGLSPTHLVVVFVVALIVLGPDKLPEAARHVGRFVAEARELSARLSGEVQQAMSIDDDKHRPTVTQADATEPLQKALVPGGDSAIADPASAGRAGQQPPMKELERSTGVGRDPRS